MIKFEIYSSDSTVSVSKLSDYRMESFSLVGDLVGGIQTDIILKLVFFLTHEGLKRLGLSKSRGRIFWLLEFRFLV